MIEQGKKASLNGFEKRVVKYLCELGWSNQDIQALVNLERPRTINFSRISSVKKDSKQARASKEEYERYFQFKRSFDLRTGLNPFADERLIKSRDSMKLAASVFNNPTLSFRAETFSMLAVVAWTYLILEYSDRNGLPTKRRNGKTVSLSDFLNDNPSFFSEGITNNLRALIKIRDASEHQLLGPFDDNWIGIFQACCLNYENEIVKRFGDRLSLVDELSFAIHFSSLKIGQATTLGNANLPEVVKSVNSELVAGLTEKQKDDTEFSFAVVYTTVASSKSESAFKFFSPQSAEGKEFVNVLVKRKPSSESHPYKPSMVVSLVKRRLGRKFTMADHTRAWEKIGVRPKGNSKKPEKTNLEYCYYNPTWKSYSYNDAWVNFLVKMFT